MCRINTLARARKEVFVLVLLLGEKYLILVLVLGEKYLVLALIYKNKIFCAVI
jgi:hypothetical protein